MGRNPHPCSHISFTPGEKTDVASHKLICFMETAAKILYCSLRTFRAINSELINRSYCFKLYSVGDRTTNQQ